MAVKFDPQPARDNRESSLVQFTPSLDDCQDAAAKMTAIVKVTNCCNLACKYCYTPDSAFFGSMSLQTVEKLIEGVATYLDRDANRHFTFLWHGGEPLLRGKPFYSRIAELQRTLLPKGLYTNLVQSNLTLLDEEYCDLFQEHQFRMGTSLDGPADLHDANRIHRESGKGSFADVMGSISLAKQRGLQISALLVINRKNIGRISDIYRFFKEQDIDIKIGSLTISGQALHNYQHVGITPLEFAACLIELFDLWFSDPDPTPAFMNLEDIVDTIMQSRPIECAHLKNCQRHFVSISPNGEVYPCGRFEGTKDFLYGSLESQTLTEIMQSPVRCRVVAQLDKRSAECKGCEWSEICNGGCMNHGYREDGTIGRDYYCEAYKRIFSYIKSRLTVELNRTASC